MLEVRLTGRDYLEFHCRVGHTFSLTEVLAAKENALEGFFWALVVTAEELAALLSEIDDRDVASRHRSRRRKALERLIEGTRSLHADDEPLVIDATDASAIAAGSRRWRER